MSRLRIEAEIVIDRPPEDVFRFTAQEHLANHPRWDPAVGGIEPLSEGALRLGSRFRISRRTGGRDEARTFEVVEWNAPARFTIETRAPGFTLRLMEDCRPHAPGGTLMVLAGEAELGRIRGLLAPLVRGRQERGLRDNLVRIKQMLEADD
jgi:uncharacterized protein YndB with AHSA1/START domain